jgi:hypothetical protein
MGIFDRMKGAFGRRTNDALVGDLAVDDGWGLVPEASPASLLASSPVRRAPEPSFQLDDVEDWDGILAAAKNRDEEDVEEEADWEAVIAKAKGSRPPLPPPRRGSVPPEVPRAPSAYLPVPRPQKKAVEEDWEALIANAKAKASSSRPSPEDEWTAAILRAKTRAA